MLQVSFCWTEMPFSEIKGTALLFPLLGEKYSRPREAQTLSTEPGDSCWNKKMQNSH